MVEEVEPGLTQARARGLGAKGWEEVGDDQAVVRGPRGDEGGMDGGRQLRGGQEAVDAGGAGGMEVGVGAARGVGAAKHIHEAGAGSGESGGGENIGRAACGREAVQGGVDHEVEVGRPDVVAGEGGDGAEGLVDEGALGCCEAGGQVGGEEGEGVAAPQDGEVEEAAVGGHDEGGRGAGIGKGARSHQGEADEDGDAPPAGRRGGIPPGDPLTQVQRPGDIVEASTMV
jgi:hypothetical protein